LDWFEKQRLISVRVFVMMFLFCNLVFDLEGIMKYRTMNTSMKLLLPFYILCFFINLFLVVQSYRTDNLNFIYYAMVLITLRNTVPILNLDSDVTFYTSSNGFMLLLI